MTKHFVFESRWEDPVIQEVVTCTLEIRSGSSTWREVASWHLPLDGKTWSELAEVGTSLTFNPGKAELVGEACVPPDLHKYTGTKAEIPKGGFLAGDSYLDYPKDDQGGS